ncbi:FMRFamide receptor-like [Dreissena polymorpha]|uniref:G-protein coupled receptors family 1 profile domain-containing protein n=1 Tax=Dreissena polymorpha TaxID=45954 RepID=A0A9D4RT71_DREPO|nr:FMRFamide receptor-like [Dreissena polymorpha]KAH3880124.1 hypothetical protein DPMN_004037 [Dreissena polymorpha]
MWMRTMVDVFSEDFIATLDIPITFNHTFLNHDFFSANVSDSTPFNHDLDTDEQKYEKTLFNYYLMGVAGTAVCFAGIVCNILCILVLTRRVMNSSTYSYLSALAVCDMLALVLTVTIFLLSDDTKFPQKGSLTWAKDSYAILFPYLHPMAVTFQVTSIWLTLGFTVDRYIMICHPFKAEHLCSVSRARKVIVFIYLLGLFFNIPRFLEYTSEEITVPTITDGWETHQIVQYTNLGKNQMFIDFVHSYMYLTFVCGVPFLTLAILNAFLIHAVQMSKKKGRMINAKEKRRNDTTVMLIGVIIIFLICQGPALVSRMVYAINIKLATSSLAFHKVNEIGNFLIILNSAVNILPYYFFGKRFRTEFWRIFCMVCLSHYQLRKLTRNLSFSIDRRRPSQCSLGYQYELNGIARAIVHRDSHLPLLQNGKTLLSKEAGQLEGLTVNNFSSSKMARKESPVSLSVILETDDNRNEKFMC